MPYKDDTKKPIVSLSYHGKGGKSPLKLSGEVMEVAIMLLIGFAIFFTGVDFNVSILDPLS